MKISNKSEFIKVNILEAGLMRPADAARFMGVKPQTFAEVHQPHMEVFIFKGVRFVSFLEVFERSLKRDLNLIRHTDKKRLEQLKEERKVLHVQRLDQIKKVIK